MAQRGFSADDEECEIINSKYLVYWPKYSQDSYNQKVSFPKMSLFGNLLIFCVFFSSTPSVLRTQRVKLTSHVKLIYWAIKMFDTLSQQINSSVKRLPNVMGPHVLSSARELRAGTAPLGGPWLPGADTGQPDVPVCSHTKLTLLEPRLVVIEFYCSYIYTHIS